MAVTMEVASWRGGELNSPVGRNKRAWGADAQQLMQLMMGVKQESAELTLDLLGKPDPVTITTTTSTPKLSSPDSFLHLDPEDSAPLPSGWEKCLDLQTGKLYFVNKSSGVSSFDDPRKRITEPYSLKPEIELQAVTVQEVPRLAHEFLGSKKSETENYLKAGCSSSSSGSPPWFSQSKELWRSHDRHNNNTSSSGSRQVRDDSTNLELDLNLAAGGNCSSPWEQQTVCTMEMIQNALKRTSHEQTLPTKTRARVLRLKSSVSSSFSSLTNSATTRCSSEPSAAETPSTSSSSSASSRSGAGLQAPSNPSSTGVCEADSSMKVEALVMGACTRCLMYVMLNKADPRCPRCDSKVPVEFGAPPCKKQRAAEGLKLGLK